MTKKLGQLFHCAILAAILSFTACGCTSPFIKHIQSAKVSIRDAEMALASGEKDRADMLIEEAKIHVEKAAAIGTDEPEFPSVVYMQGMLAAFQGDQKEALLRFNEAVKLEPENPEFLARFGTQLCSVGETLLMGGKEKEGLEFLADGRKQIEKAVKADPQFGGGYLLLANVYYITGNVSEARKHLKKGVSLMLEGGEEPPSIEEKAGIYSRIAQLAERVQDPETAEEYRRLAFETDPTRRKHLVDYVRILGALGTPEKLDRARKLLEDAIDREPGVGELSDVLGLIYVTLRQDKKALESLEQARRLGALSFEGHLATAQLLDRSNRSENAYVLLEEYFETLKKDGAIERAVVIALSLSQLIVAEPLNTSRPGELGKIDSIRGSRALKILTSALEITPENLEISHARAFVYLLMRKLPEAKEIADRILAEGGQRAWTAHTLYLNIYRENGDIPNAVDSARKVIEADPTLIPYYMVLVELLRDKPDEAAEILKSGLEKNPDNPDLLGTFTSLALETEDFETAGIHSDRLIEKYPKYFLGYFLRACIALGVSDTDTAESSIQQAKDLAPNNEARVQIDREWRLKKMQLLERQMKEEKFPDPAKFGSLEPKEKEAFIYRATVAPSADGLAFIRLAFGDNNAFIRTQALQGLMQYNASDVAPLLKIAFSDENEKVRAIAAHFSAQMDFEGRLNALVEMLADESAYVREVSGAVLRRLTGKRFGFRHDADAQSRAAAIKRWKKYISSQNK
ncbi:MAG: tetratricopeptide repeat protein [Planctomycetota bacterium]|jgi:tetratricopeptide (TPR) repeat protein